jgi:hypothetical protein
VELLQTCGDLVRGTVVTDLVPLDEGPAFLTELAQRRRSAVQAVFVMTS